MTVFDFKTTSDTSNWKIVDDTVMGGRSNGHFELSKDGHGVFYGEVSLENNGGFSSVRYIMNKKSVETFSKFKLRIKGDGKTYQFRAKNDSGQRYNYLFEFDSSGDWETITIPFSEMYASFRGNRLDIPNYRGNHLQEIAFLIGNKKEQKFKLLIDSITVE